MTYAFVHLCICAILIRMSAQRSPVESLSPTEAEALRAQVAEQGAVHVATSIGVDLRTLYKALAGVEVHRLTLRVIRASRI